MISSETVDALYLALLGQRADPDGLAFWCSAPSVEGVIAGLTATDRYRSRTRALAGASASSSAPDALAQGAWRLQLGRGLMELIDLPQAAAPHLALENLPWAEIDPDPRSEGVEVLGRYATELAAELRRRAPGTLIQVGLPNAGVTAPHAADTLILTRYDDLRALQWCRPDMIRAVRRRMLVPVYSDPRRPADECAADRETARRFVHGLGFVEVRQVFRRRHSEDQVHIDSTYSTPDLDTLQAVPGDRVDRASTPVWTWLIADRIGSETPR
ncbi:MAG: hypothetical protein ACOH17_08345 [Cellulomonas sp.]